MRMQRIALLLSTVCLMGACVAGTWVAARPQIQPFLSPNATDVQVVGVDLWESDLTYRAAGPPYAWYFAVMRNLTADGWVSPERHSGGPLPASEVYVRVVPLGLASLTERAEVQGDLNSAHIHLWRRISMP
jgi:hypothetical protein